MAEQVEAPELSPEEEIRGLIQRSRAAQQQIEHYTQEQVDELIRAMVWSVARPGMAEEIADGMDVLAVHERGQHLGRVRERLKSVGQRSESTDATGFSIGFAEF